MSTATRERRFTYVVVRYVDGKVYSQNKLDLTVAEAERYRANGYAVNGPVSGW